MPDMSRYLRGYSRGLTIIEWTYTIDKSKNPKISAFMGENKEEKLVDVQLEQEVLNKIINNQYGLFRSCFLIGGNGDFIPIYIEERSVNPYSLGSHPKYIGVQYMDLYRRTGINFLIQGNLEKIKILYSTLEKHIERDIRPIIVATYRLLTFFSPYKTLIDKIIDGVIALEALLLPNIKTELNFRLSLRTSLLIGETENERVAIFNTIKKAYEHRSNLIHGESKPIKLQQSFPNDFYQTCMKTYIKCLDIYDSDSYNRPQSFSKDYGEIFKKIEFFHFKDSPSRLEDILDLTFTTYEKYKEFITTYI